ncbi:hypothetical protein [Clostridium polyendosporum]|nr:hypothetical protein [Clostridium polyendosporum]
MGIDDPYLAFCFDEAIAHIQSFMYYNDKGVLKWRKTPHWINEKKQQNNSQLFNSMKENLKRFKNTKR